MALANAINAIQTGIQSQTSSGVWNGRTITAGTGISVTNGDGISGNPTIAATGSFGGVGDVVVYEDFIGSSPTVGGNLEDFSGSIGWTHTQSSNTKDFAFGTPDSGHPGVLSISCNSSAPANGSLITGDSRSTSIGLFLAGGAITYSTVVKLSVLGTGAQDYTCYVGIGNLSDPSIEVTNGVYFFYNQATNSGNWVGKTASGGSRNSVNSSVAASTNYVKLGFTVNAAATSVEFFINGVSIGTQASTIPSTQIGFFYQMAHVAGANTKSLAIDLLTFNQTLTIPR